MASVTDNRVPPLVRLANLAGAAGAPLGLSPERPTPDSLIAEVEGRADPEAVAAAAGEPYRAAFDSALGAAAEGTELTPFGRWGVAEVARRMLQNRLGIARALQRAPRIGQEPLPSPVFVVGWFRSGTTLLHRLLSSAEGARIPRAWELYFPVPGPGDPARDARRRRARMRRMLRMAHLAIPALPRMHRIDADSPEEATVLLDNAGVGVYFLHAFGAHGHGRFLADHDLGYAYHSMAQQLRLLSHAGGTGRWILKCPFSMWKLEALFSTFPDARIVHTHRDPRESVASVCSLSAILQQSFCREVDLHAIGRFWSDFYLEGLKRSAAFRRAHPDAPIVDVPYRRLVDDTGAVLRELGQTLSLRLPPDSVARQRQQGGYGRHAHDLASFGLDADVLMERFAPHLPHAG